jgi:hypothetical protein
MVVVVWVQETLGPSFGNFWPVRTQTPPNSLFRPTNTYRLSQYIFWHLQNCYYACGGGGDVGVGGPTLFAGGHPRNIRPWT